MKRVSQLLIFFFCGLDYKRLTFLLPKANGMENQMNESLDGSLVCARKWTFCVINQNLLVMKSN